MDTQFSPTVSVSRKSQRAFITQLRIGEILEARVLAQSGKHLRLGIGQQILSAELTGPQTAISSGTKFEVVKLEPVPVLKIAHLNKATESTVANRFVRQALPTQRPLQMLFSNLSAINTDASGKSISNTDRARSNLLIQTISHIETHTSTLRNLLSPHGLRSAIENSGIFLENRLAAVSKNKSKYIDFADLKGTLLRAQGGLQSISNARSKQLVRGAAAEHSGNSTVTKNLDESLGSLFKAVETGLARIEVLQFANNALASAGHNASYVELPIRVADRFETIQILIEQESSSTADAISNTSSTSIYVEIPISVNESVQAKVLAKAEALFINLWSENQRIQQRLRDSKEELENALSKTIANNATIAVRRFDNKIPDPVAIFSELVRDSA